MVKKQVLPPNLRENIKTVILEQMTNPSDTNYAKLILFTLVDDYAAKAYLEMYTEKENNTRARFLFHPEYVKECTDIDFKMVDPIYMDPTKLSTCMDYFIAKGVLAKDDKDKKDNGWNKIIDLVQLNEVIAKMPDWIKIVQKKEEDKTAADKEFVKKYAEMRGYMVMKVEETIRELMKKANSYNPDNKAEMHALFAIALNDVKYLEKSKDATGKQFLRALSREELAIAKTLYRLNHSIAEMFMKEDKEQEFLKPPHIALYNDINMNLDPIEEYQQMLITGKNTQRLKMKIMTYFDEFQGSAWKNWLWNIKSVNQHLSMEIDATKLRKTDVCSLKDDFTNSGNYKILKKELSKDGDLMAALKGKMSKVMPTAKKADPKVQTPVKKALRLLTEKADPATTETKAEEVDTEAIMLEVETECEMAFRRGFRGYNIDDKELTENIQKYDDITIEKSAVSCKARDLAIADYDLIKTKIADDSDAKEFVKDMGIDLGTDATIDKLMKEFKDLPNLARWAAEDPKV